MHKRFCTFLSWLALHRKWHALKGNLLALFVVEMLEDAIQKIVNAITNNTMATDDPARLLLEQFEAQDRADFDKFWQSDYPDSLKLIIADKSEHANIDWDLLVKGPVYCHTALLPAQIRTKLFLTYQKSQPVNDTFSVATVAISRIQADAAVPAVLDDNNRTMRIVYEDADRNLEDFVNCSEPPHIDYNEYFYVNAVEDWKTVVVPNDAEIKEYGVKQAPTKGMIAFSFNECPGGNINVTGILAGDATFYVNGNHVMNLTQFHAGYQECVLMLSGPDAAGGGSDRYYWQPNNEGRFEIRARVTKVRFFLRVTSFIVWYHAKHSMSSMIPLVPSGHRNSA